MVTKLILAVMIFQAPTKEEVWSSIKKLGIKHPEVVFAQAVIESGAFNSYLAKTCNNLFGMRIAKKRPTLAQKGCNYKHGFAKYQSWHHSIEDYKMYQTYVLRDKPTMTDEQYLKYIARTYAKNTEYVELIKTTIRKNKKITNNT